MKKLKQLLFIIALFFSLSATADTLDTAFSAKYKIATQLFTKLHQGDSCSVKLENYFTPELCKQIKDKKLYLSMMTPNKEWTDWNTSNSETYSFIPEKNEYIKVKLSSPKAYDSLSTIENLSPEDVYNTYKVIYIKFDKTTSGYRITSVKSEDEYMQETYGSLIIAAPED